MTAKDFLMSLPSQINPAAIEGHNTCFHFNLGDAGQYTLQVDDGNCSAQEGLVGTPKCSVTTTEKTLLGILDGSVNPMMAAFTGKLKMSNQGEMLRYAKIFGLM
jgi:putative sterol carrier protein